MALPDGDHVGDARRNPQVVLENPEPLGRTDQIGAADGHPDSPGRFESPHLDAVLGAAEDHVGRDDPIGDDPGRTVDVPEEGVERSQALLEALCQAPPLRSGHHPREAVDRDDALVGHLVAVDRERDALVGE